MSYIEHRIPTKDGPKLFLREYAGHGGRTRVPVLCIPGLTRNSADFEVVAPRIAALGRRVLAIDLRGRGFSDYDPDPGRYRPDVYVGDVLYALETLGVARAVFIGTSLGGIVTMLAATMEPERVAAVVLNDIGPVVDPAGLARIASYVGKSGPFASWSALIEAVKASQGQAFPAADDSFWKTFVRRVAHALPDGRVAFSYDPAIAQVFSQPQTEPTPSLLPFFQALVAKPVLVVRGALSDILSADGVAAMKQAKPDIDYIEVPRVGHAPSLEEPEAWQAIAAFLARIP
jgi:pimeloyl-ACP methyl ester carboxylesterase